MESCITCCDPTPSLHPTHGPVPGSILHICMLGACLVWCAMWSVWECFESNLCAPMPLCYHVEHITHQQTPCLCMLVYQMHFPISWGRDLRDKKRQNWIGFFMTFLLLQYCTLGSSLRLTICFCKHVIAIWKVERTSQDLFLGSLKYVFRFYARLASLGPSHWCACLSGCTDLGWL